MITPFFKPNIGGVETHLEDLCKYLTHRGYRVFVITYQPLSTKATGPMVEREDNLQVRRIPWFGYNWFNLLEPNPVAEALYLFPALFLYSLFFMLTNFKKINIVHTHGIVASLIGKFLKLLFRLEFVTTVHTTYYLDKRPLLRKIFAWILSSYDKILFVSHGIRREFVESGIDPAKAKVFTYWADGSRFKPMNKLECRKMLGLNCEFLVLFVGRLIREKGVHIFIETARMSDNRIKFVVVTSGSIEEFERMVGSDIPTNVIYIGPVEYSKLHLYYNAADLFILPSQYREGFSRAVLESALCGTPVVASKVGCLPEVVTEDVGILVNPPTPHAFHKVIEYFFNNDEALRNLSSKCSKYARKMFTEENAKIIEEAYYRK
jgi:glycosyltransferase involved in cell wall biosynthesis